MSTPPPSIAAGWYPDPEDPGALRYWDGRNWTSQTHPIAGKVPSAASMAIHLPANSLTLGRVVQILVGLCGVVAVFSTAVEIWGFQLAASGARNPNTINLDSYELYDRLYGMASVISFAAMILAGIVWLSWQYRLAASVPRIALRRGAGWHIAAWFVPVVSLWFPVQNLADLRGALTGSRAPSRPAGGYWLWWGTWLGSSFAAMLALRLESTSLTLSAVADQTATLAVGDALNAVAAVLAILVVGDITSAARASLQPGAELAGN